MDTEGTPPPVRSDPAVLVVVVTYRSEATAASQFATLAAWAASRPDVRIAVTENSFSDATVELARRHLPDAVAEVARSEVNVGFAPAVNAAVHAAERRWGPFEVVVLLNPDVVTTTADLDAVCATLDDDSIGIGAPALIGEDGAVDRGSLRRDWNRRRLFAEIVGIPSIARLLGSPTRYMALPAHGDHVDVDIASGAFMAIRRDVFAAGLDTRLPMYLEDQEICIRCRRGGLRVVTRCSRRVRHIGGASSHGVVPHKRELRMMELASAPAMALREIIGAGRADLALLVAVAGAVRAAVALLALGVSVRSAQRRSWARDQLTLARWFVARAISGRLLRPVSWAPVAVDAAGAHHDAAPGQPASIPRASGTER